MSSNWDWYAESTRQNEINRRRYEAWWWGCDTAHPNGEDVQQSTSPDALSNAPQQQVELADLSLANQKVHLAVIGDSGIGKSTLTMYLASQLSGNIKVYDTDASPDEWVGLDVIGRSGNIDAITLAMQADIDELAKRTELRGKGLPIGGEYIRIIEEFSTIQGDIGKLANTWLEKLLRRGRKYKMKIYLVSQQKNVKALGLDGQGDLRDNLAFLLLGKPAIKHAQMLTNKKQLAESSLHWLLTQNRPAMLEDEVIEIPNLANWNSGNECGNGLVTPLPVLTPVTNVLPSGNGFGNGNGNQDFMLVTAYKALLDIGYSKSKIVKEIMGKSGRHFDAGMAELERLLSL